MADIEPDPSETPQARLERHRRLGLHDAVIDDLNDIADLHDHDDCA